MGSIDRQRDTTSSSCLRAPYRAIRASSTSTPPPRPPPAPNKLLLSLRAAAAAIAAAAAAALKVGLLLAAGALLLAAASRLLLLLARARLSTPLETEVALSSDALPAAEFMRCSPMLTPPPGTPPSAFPSAVATVDTSGLPQIASSAMVAALLAVVGFVAASPLFDQSAASSSNCVADSYRACMARTCSGSVGEGV